MFFKTLAGYLVVIFILLGLIALLSFKTIENHSDDQDILIQELKTNIIIAILIVIIVSVLIAAAVSRNMSKHVRELSEAIKSLASGNFKVKVLPNKGELKKFTDDFNYIKDQIEELFRDLSIQKEKIANVIYSIREGLIVIDKKDKIVLSNESFNKFFQTGSIEGRFYWEIVRSSQFNELIEKVMGEKKNIATEVVLNDKTFLCSASFLSSTEEIVIIFHDITDIRNLERIKRDFVANISHELRTPLTSIKGYTETLEEEIDESHRHYLDIIKRNVERLINIVQDLLILSELERKGTTLQLEDVNLKVLIEDIFRIFEHKVKEKNLSLKLSAEDNFPQIKVDLFKLEQVFINLIENAVKYTEKGEISISLKQRSGNAVIEVQDTGIGITEAHLPRIFERFYVVDKSRSRRLGGTGLGLSIVKHIILLHNGSIDVESTYGLGTRFIIILPINPT